MKQKNETRGPGNIEGLIHTVRAQKVILDADLAMLFGVPGKRLNEQVKRNATRFPADFMFQLTLEEFVSLRSQIATLKSGRGKHRKYLPYAFTERSDHGRNCPKYRAGRADECVRRARVCEDERDLEWHS